MNGDEKYIRVHGEMVAAANEVLELEKESGEWCAEVTDFLKVLAKEEEVSIRMDDALDILYSQSVYLERQTKLNEKIQSDLLDYVELVGVNLKGLLRGMKSKNFYVLRVDSTEIVTDYGRSRGQFFMRVVVMTPLHPLDLRGVIAEFEDDVAEDWTTAIGFLEAGDEAYNPSDIKFEEWTEKDRKEAKRFHYEDAWEEAGATISRDISWLWDNEPESGWKYGSWFLEDTWEATTEFSEKATHRLNTILSFFGLQEALVEDWTTISRDMGFLGLLVHNPYNLGVEGGWDSTGLIHAATLELPTVAEIKAAVKASKWSAKEAAEGSTRHAGGQALKWKDKPELVEKPWFMLSLMDFKVSL
tara:strand:- start:639 stop:1712 length:1074 start_codon:yes stop_codon:yes gene_type:complete